ncbi:MAG: LysE family translocator [Rhodothalassiaceae bacterium]
MTVTGLLTLSFAAWLLALTPGPVMAAVIATAGARGAAACLGLILGVALADVVLIGLALAGLVAAAQALGPWFLAVKLIGGGYLIWLGIRLWRTGAAEAEPAARPKRFWRGVAAGWLINIANPKAILFYAAFLPTFVDIRALGPAAAVVVMAATITPMVANNLAVAMGAGRLARWAKRTRAARWINRATGGVMIGAGVAVATR